MGNPNGSLIIGTPINFDEAEAYLKCASRFWNSLSAAGSGNVLYGQLTLTGTNEELNIFTFDSTNVYGSGLALNQLNGINIVAPLKCDYFGKCKRNKYSVRKLSDIQKRYGGVKGQCQENIMELL